MSRFANTERFTQTWYNPPYPTTIEEVEAGWPQYSRNAAKIVQMYPSISKIGVAGAGFGATLYYLYFTHGKDPWGCDIAWAANQGAGTLKAASNRLMSADVLVPADMERWRRAATGAGNRSTKIPLIFTEDLLPCAESDAEVQTMLTNLRAIGTQLIHLVSPQTGNEATTDMLWRTPAQWRALIGPNEPILLPSLEEVA